MTTKLPAVAFRNIFRNLRRSSLSAIAIAVSAMAIMALLALFECMEADMETNLTSYYTGEVRIRHESFEKYERYNPLHLSLDMDAVLPLAKSVEGVEAATSRINFPANLYLDGKNNGALGVGVDFATEAAFIDFPSLVSEGRLPQKGKNELLIGAILAHDLQLELGDKITVLTSTALRGSNAMTFEVVGIASFPVGGLSSKTLYIPLDRAQYMLRMEGHTQEILLQVADGYKEADVAQAVKELLEAELGLGTETKAWKDLNMMYSFLSIAKFIYYVMAGVFFVLGSTVIINTTMMVIYERMREIGTLAALGMQGKELTRLFLLEGSFISMAGSTVGTIAGLIIIAVLGKVGLNFTEAMSGVDMEISSILYPQVNWWIALFVWFYAILTATLSTLIPSRRASKIQIVEALRYV
ncbi:MAG: ABC transporter permease [Sphaerochaeta sp.]|jgi:putative ABC transport system permease protein|uniref:ABC transporter permease n=1 Tax=Sphaerochaeta sp. TaxID=1972642 RepID=UPI002A371E73|nr:ABC transporter permease [Sphaerochaeta sp.]MDX9825334.1 ABC transporter permease [Sphaerochaeta sp.]